MLRGEAAHIRRRWGRLRSGGTRGAGRRGGGRQWGGRRWFLLDYPRTALGIQRGEPTLDFIRRTIRGGRVPYLVPDFAVLALLHITPRQNPISVSYHFGNGLVGLNLVQGLPRFERLSFLHKPRNYLRVLHRSHVRNPQFDQTTHCHIPPLYRPSQPREPARFRGNLRNRGYA